VYGFCDSENGQGDHSVASYDLLHQALQYALEPFTFYSPSYSSAPRYLTNLNLARVILFATPRLGYRLMLGGWDEVLFCPISLVKDLRSMLLLEDRPGIIVTDPAVETAAEEMIAILGDDRSDSCFRDLRRSYMCSASTAGSLHVHKRV